MTQSKLVHADNNLTITFDENTTQSELRAKTVEMGAPIGKTSLSNLLNNKVEQTGGWVVVRDAVEVVDNETKGGEAPAATPAPAADPQETVDDLASLVAAAGNVAPASSDAAPAAEPAPVVDTPAPAAVAAPATEEAAPAPDAAAAPAPEATKAPAAPKATGAVRYERQASIDALMGLVDYEPILKEAPTETYVTLKLKKARIQATVGVRGVTLMLFPLKGLVLQEIDPAKTGWTVKAQYAKIGVYAPETVGAELVKIEAEIAKLA